MESRAVDSLHSRLRGLITIHALNIARHHPPPPSRQKLLKRENHERNYAGGQGATTL